jgi:hypothetical protein
VGNDTPRPAKFEASWVISLKFSVFSFQSRKLKDLWGDLTGANSISSRTDFFSFDLGENEVGEEILAGVGQLADLGDHLFEEFGHLIRIIQRELEHGNQ